MAAVISWFEPSLLSDPFGSLLLQAEPVRGLGYDLTSVLVFSLFGIAFVVVTVSILSRMLRPRALPESEPAKTDTYECGEPAIGSSWVRFDIRFYMVALIFLIFDVEVAFLYPWGVIFKQFRQYEVAGLGRFIFLEMLIFIAILLVGFIYCWKKGDLDWVKSLQSQSRPGKPRTPADEIPHEVVPEEGPKSPALARSR